MSSIFIYLYSNNYIVYFFIYYDLFIYYYIHSGLFLNVHFLFYILKSTYANRDAIIGSLNSS